MKSLPPSPPGSLAIAPDGDAPFSTGTSPAATRIAAGDPIRILGGGGDAFARRLLESAGGDGIPEATLRRLAEALSVPLPAPPAGSLSTVASAARATRSSVLRTYATSIVGLAVIGVLASQWPTPIEPERTPHSRTAASQHPDMASRSESASRSASADAAEATGAAEATAAAEAGSLQPAPPPTEAAAVVASASHSAITRVDTPRRPHDGKRGMRIAVLPKARAADEGPALAQELRALELAQQALRTSRVDQAERALAAYAQSFPRPTLGIEAELLEIDVLVARGQRQAATLRARALVARAGTERYRERLAALLHEEANVP